MEIKECLYYKKLKDKAVRCILCPNFCYILDGKVGVCRTRKNIEGQLVSLSYGLPVAMHVDSIYKKPIYNFLQGTNTFSIGTVGCNLRCKFCQNFEMSQANAEDVAVAYVSPEEVVNRAVKANCPSISYTYSDPVAFYEYVYDCAKIAREKGLKNILVMNGYINPAPIKDLCKYIDAANVDIKAFSEKFYKDICFGKLAPILECLRIMKKYKVHLEITNLLIPRYNDNMKDIESMCVWIKKYLGKETPLHFSRFFPMYKLRKANMTPLSTMKKAEKIAKKYLDNVYLGNV